MDEWRPKYVYRGRRGYSPSGAAVDIDGRQWARRRPSFTAPVPEDIPCEVVLPTADLDTYSVRVSVRGSETVDAAVVHHDGVQAYAVAVRGLVSRCGLDMREVEEAVALAPVDFRWDVLVGFLGEARLSRLREVLTAQMRPYCTDSHAYEDAITAALEAK